MEHIVKAWGKIPDRVTKMDAERMYLRYCMGLEEYGMSELNCTI